MSGPRPYPRLGAASAALAAAVLLVPAHAIGQGSAAAKRYTVPELVKAMSPAVVFIGNTGRNGQVESIGSGFIVDAGGLIVTNFHVIEGAQALQIKTKDGEIYDRVEVVDHDERRDLAVLKVRPFKPLPTVQLASADPEVGEDAVAIGNPKGLEHTVTAGMVSAFRQAEGYRLMQISVPISPGSSGGPVFNMAGRVIGVATSQVKEAQNLNFAVPIDYARPLIESKNTPLTVAEFTRKMGGVKPEPTAARGGSSAGANRNPGGGGARLGSWSVAHDHGNVFETFCLGRLYVTADSVGFTNDSGIHIWEVPLDALREIAKNSVYGVDKNAFHIRLVTNTNYNLVAINDQMQFVAPDMIILQVLKAAKSK
jgi:S1-C subfamily serine protease